MFKLKLDNWQRLTLLTLVGGIQGDVATMRKAMTLLDTLELNESEKEEIGLTANENGSVSWKTEKEWEVEFKNPDAVVLLKEHVKKGFPNPQNPQEKTWTVLMAKRMMSVFDQLEL